MHLSRLGRRVKEKWGKIGQPGFPGLELSSLELTFQTWRSPRPPQLSESRGTNKSPRGSPRPRTQSPHVDSRACDAPTRPGSRHRQCRASFPQPLRDPRPAPPGRPPASAGDTHRHQELQRAHIVPLGLLELAEHAHAQAKLLLQVLGALGAAVSAAVLAHGRRRCAARRCPPCWALTRAPAAARPPAARMESCRLRQLRGETEDFTCWGEAGRRERRGSGWNPGAGGAGLCRGNSWEWGLRPGPARPAPLLWPHTAGAGGEAASAATAVTWTLIKSFVSVWLRPFTLHQISGKRKHNPGEVLHTG